MALDSAADYILRELPKEWQGWALVVSFTPLLKRIPTRKQVTRDKAQLKLLNTAGTILEHMETLLAADFHEPASVESLILASGFRDCLFFAQGRETLKEIIITCLRAGENIWDVLGTNPIKVTLYHDHTHPRIW